MCLFGGCTPHKQPNDQIINNTFQRHFRRGVLKRNLNLRKAMLASNNEEALKPLSNDELVNIAATAFDVVLDSPDKIIKRSYEIAGFCDDKTKWGSFLRESVENPPSLNDIPKCDQRPYDPTGQQPVRNRSTPVDVVDKYPITCSVCGQYFTYKYSKHVKAHIASCPYKEMLHEWKPTPWRKTLFFRRNF